MSNHPPSVWPMLTWWKLLSPWCSVFKQRQTAPVNPDVTRRLFWLSSNTQNIQNISGLTFSFQIEIVHPLNDNLIVQVSLTESIRCPQLFINNVDSPYLKWTLSQICFPAPHRPAGLDWTPPVRKMQLGLSALCWPWCEETAAFARTSSLQMRPLRLNR